MIDISKLIEKIEELEKTNEKLLKEIEFLRKLLDEWQRR